MRICVPLSGPGAMGAALKPKEGADSDVAWCEPARPKCEHIRPVGFKDHAEERSRTKK